MIKKRRNLILIFCLSLNIFSHFPVLSYAWLSWYFKEFQPAYTHKGYAHKKGVHLKNDPVVYFVNVLWWQISVL